NGSAQYGTINGTSAAAAVVAGDAALLAQARPDLDAGALKGVLVGAARPLPDDSITAQGAGLVDVGGAAATEIVGLPATLALGRATGAHWLTRHQLVFRNVSGRRLRLSLQVKVVHEGAATLQFRLRPNQFYLAPGRSLRVHLEARVTSALDGEAPAGGALVATPLTGREIRIPWVITFGPVTRPALTNVHL